MSSDLDFHKQLVLAAVSGLTVSGKCPDDKVADRAFKIANSIIDQYPGDNANSGD